MESEPGEAPACTAGRGPSSARDIGALFRRHGEHYRSTHALGAVQRRALRDISVCRTGALGGHRHICARCSHQHVVYNSCRNRHCPKCQALRQARWVAARMQRALPVRHFHVVFTLPAELRPLVREHQVALLELLFVAAAETIVALGRDPKRLGALVGVTAVVHTWGRNLSFHPHLHCIVTGGGLAGDGAWIDSRERYLLPVKVLGRMFRGKFLDGLARLFQQGKLAPGPRCDQHTRRLLQPSAFAQLKNALYEKNWVVYAKAPFKRPAALFRYLGQYTHRVAISNHRLLHVDEQEVVFRTRRQGVCRLSPTEFMRRFLQHVLPRGFVKIRHFGLLAPGNVNTKLAEAHAALDRRSQDALTSQPTSEAFTTVPADWRSLFRQLTGLDIATCPDCGADLSVEPLLENAHSARAPPPTSPS